MVQYVFFSETQEAAAFALLHSFWMRRYVLLKLLLKVRLKVTFRTLQLLQFALSRF